MNTFVIYKVLVVTVLWGVTDCGELFLYFI